jgi:hypothetical protein
VGGVPTLLRCGLTSVEETTTDPKETASSLAFRHFAAAASRRDCNTRADVVFAEDFRGGR